MADGYAWHDIWPDLTADNKDGYSTLHRRYGRRVGRQDSWGFEIVKRLQREEREGSWR